MDAKEAAHLITYEVNVAESIDCGHQARTHISSICHTLQNQSERKWNELRLWIKDNPDASLEDIVHICEKLDKGDSIRLYTRIYEEAI